MSSRKRQWSPSRRAKMSSPKLPRALLSISLHWRKSWAAQVPARGVWETENPQAGKRDVSLARLGTDSLQSIKQFTHFKACVSPYFPTCTASSHSRDGGWHLLCNGPQVERKGNIWLGLLVPHVHPHQMTWSQGHSWPKDSSTSQTWGWKLTSHLVRGSFPVLPRGWFWDDMAGSRSSEKAAWETARLDVSLGRE